ncbi:MAG TPA: hypothetical protein VGP79_00360 [Bryobacteraceae bacterium]|jgi:hypothetical protein|nr:hypothetical protein [Bryobacteraceae bacterium]
MFQTQVQHSTLVAMGVRWLSRQSSVVLYEFAATAVETPDVIGWASGAGSVLIECKLNRSDFLRDAVKPFRKNPRVGMGQRRYYLCPPNTIQVKDLPPKWGLLWAAKGEVVVKREARGHADRNLVAEVKFLSSMLRRAQIRIGTRPLSEWLRGENRLEAKRGVSPNRYPSIQRSNRTLP